MMPWLQNMRPGEDPLSEGSYRNIKITTPEDLVVAEAFLKENRE